MIKRGFTLIELLVVITILAILAGAALPYVQAYVAEARIAKAKTDLEEIGRALAVYETREGDYTKNNVSDLTGRYLNKAPIDPWGRPYLIDVDAGLVISGGPDRNWTTIEDNIQVPYQPPLALVSVKWVDRNQSGAVDIQNVSDQIQLQFSRKLGNATADLDAGAINGIFEANINGSTQNMSTLVDGDTVSIIADKTVIYNVVTNDAFVPGRDTINVIQGHATIIDQATPASNFSIAEQGVVILPL